MKNCLSRFGGLVILASFTASLAHAQFSVLWWDSTPNFGSSTDVERQEMADSIGNYDGGSLFSSTYVSNLTSGALASHLASNSYDVIVLDATGGPSSRYNADDIAALQAHYAANSNLMLDGTLYIRNLVDSIFPDAAYPGANGALEGFTLNQINELATRGGGVLIGTDHTGFQAAANAALAGLVPSASFSQNINPSTTGSFYGADLLDSLVPVAAVDMLNSWDTVPSVGSAPTGSFLDFEGTAITLYSQVDVANDPGTGPLYSFISTSWEPGEGITDISDDTPGGDSGEDDSQEPVIPEPSALGLLGFGAVVLLLGRRRTPRE